MLTPPPPCTACASAAPLFPRNFFLKHEPPAVQINICIYFIYVSAHTDTYSVSMCRAMYTYTTTHTYTYIPSSIHHLYGHLCKELCVGTYVKDTQDEIWDKNLTLCIIYVYLRMSVTQETLKCTLCTLHRTQRMYLCLWVHTYIHTYRKTQMQTHHSLSSHLCGVLACILYMYIGAYTHKQWF